MRIARWLAAAVLSLAFSAEATLHTFRARLTSLEEVPRLYYLGADGTATVAYDDATGVLNWTIGYVNVTSNASTGFYAAPVGQVGPLQLAVPCAPCSGSATITGPQGQDLINGYWYVNVKTDLHPEGQIRGQLQPRVFPGDYSNDRRPDLVWRNVSTGAVYLWRMNGLALESDQYLGTVGGPTVKILGADLFTRKGNPQLLHASNESVNYWDIVGGAYRGNGFIFDLDSPWEIVAIADFNADTHPDFLVRHPTSGLAFIWYFNGVTPGGSQFLFTIDPVWKVENIGDFNNDGFPDLFFRNIETGIGFAWNTSSDGTTTTMSDDHFMFGIDPVWEVVQVADWNNDGQVDLLFRNRDTGVVFVWYLVDGYTLAGSDFVVQIDPSWEIARSR